MLKRPLVVLALVSSMVLPFAAGFAQPAEAPLTPELPYEIQRLKRKNAVRSTLRDYDVRLAELYRKAVERWQKDFIANRESRLESAGQTLAQKAAAIRDKREVNWAEVGRDSEFVKASRAEVAKLLQPEEVRSQLASWAEELERTTRLEMLRCFQQMVAYDLGLKFDEKLRGKVARAVLSIPVEELISKKATVESLVGSIQAGLPGVVLNEDDKKQIALAASVLVHKGVKWLAVAQLELPPTWAELLGGAAGSATDWLAQKGLEWIDRKLTGEPQAQKIASNLRLALKAWNEQHLAHRLDRIVHKFRGQVIDFLEAEGRKVTF